MATIFRYDPIYVDGILFRDDKARFHAAVPSLDVIGYGGTKEEAKDSLVLAMYCYFEHAVKCGFVPEHIRRPLCDADMKDVYDCIQSGTCVYNISCAINLP